MKKEHRLIVLDYILAGFFLIVIIYMYEIRRTPTISPATFGTPITSTTPNVSSAIASHISTTAPEPLSLLFARTDTERDLGLGQRASLPADEGMLFIFNTPAQYAFWMKDMSFPIDMIWLDADFNIVYIASNVSPATYPETFSPNPTSEPSLYVLETNAGYAARNELTIGEPLGFVKTAVEGMQQ